MKDIWIKNKLSIIIISYLIVFGLLIYFAARPLVKRIESVSSQIQEKIVDQKIEDERLNSLPQMEKDWEYFESQKGVADVMLSPGSEISFIESIDSVAQKSGNVMDLKIGDQVDPKEIAKIKAGAKKSKEEKGIMDEINYNNYFPMQINIRGDYSNLVNFLHMIENEHFYVNIIGIDSKKQTIDTNLEKANQGIFSPDKDKVQTKEVIVTSINAIVYTQ